MSEKEPVLTRGLPMLALRGMTAFPGMLLTFDIERPMSMAALNFAMGADQNIFLVTQRGFEPRTPCLKGRCSAN